MSNLISYENPYLSEHQAKLLFPVNQYERRNYKKE